MATLLTNDLNVSCITTVSNASHGTVSFDYVVDDGNGGTITATANILVGSEDDAP